MKEEPTILLCSEPHNLALAGGKAFALWQLREAGLPVPIWLVVTPNAMRDGSMTDAARDDLHLALEASGLAGKALAVRSSSTEEDAANSSFAGQFESFLGIDESELEETIQRVWKSGDADRVLAYKESRGEASLAQPPAALVQEMVAADVAGVAFSANPVSGNWDEAVVSAVVGLGSSLVDGESDADSFVIDRAGKEIERTVARKVKARRLSAQVGYGIKEDELTGEEAAACCLTVEQAREVAALARRCEAFFGRPQDIEWAISDGRLYLLQSRPITTLASVPYAGGRLFIWDNSNIAESYSGITLPLTFSFARYIYTEVYRQFCRLLQVSSRRVARHQAVFGQMLGLIRGRVYYNLISWYKVLALLPGYELNQGFMEQMMGVKEGLSPDAKREVETVRENGKLADSLNLVRSLGGLLWKHLTIERDVRRFYHRFEKALNQASKPLEAMRLEELADHFHQLERDLLTSWDAPLVNDFFAMVFFGILKKQCEKRVPEDGARLCNDLICGIGGIISAEPAARMKAMAGLASGDEALVSTLRYGTRPEVERALGRNAALREAVEAYLEKFGDRCLDELKLESAALLDDPTLLYRSIGELAAASGERRSEMNTQSFDTKQAEAEAALWKALEGKPIGRAWTRWVLKHARRRVGSRENLRFERTRLFGRIRRLFLEMGKRLFAFNVIDAPRDVFYLEIYEIIGYVEGSGVSTDLRALIDLRKKEYEQFASEEPPEDRFETRGAVPIGNAFRAEPRKGAVESTAVRGNLQGIGCCPGVVRGVARVVRDPQKAALQRGEILVAKQTDPGWIMLFPLAAGLLVERGSLLSHSAIVSRELGLPSVVSLKGLLEAIETGDEIEMNGATGEVRILNRLDAVGEDEDEDGGRGERG